MAAPTGNASAYKSERNTCRRYNQSVRLDDDRLRSLEADAAAAAALLMESLGLSRCFLNILVGLFLVRNVCADGYGNGGYMGKFIFGQLISNFACMHLISMLSRQM